MSTLVLNAYSKAYPLITNRLRASVYLQSSPQAFIASIIDNVAGHPERVWSFPGLPRNNYGFVLEEINGSDVVVANLAKFDVVPGEHDGELIRDDEQIQVGTTVGLDADTNSFVFDGTGGKPNYIGWEIVLHEISGRGILITGGDYSWDKITGTFNLLQDFDKFQAGVFYNIHFNPIQDTIGNSYPTLKDFSIELITGDTVLTAASFGKKLIIEPSSSYIEVTVPAIATVVEGRPLMVEIGGTNIVTVKFIFDVNLVWLRGSLYAMAGESFSLYKFVRPLSVAEWRVSEADGNFRNVGQHVDEDMIQADVINKQLMDGSTKNKDQYGRIYNEVVLNLPLTQVVAYADWATGNNKYLYSLANLSGDFHFPDRRGMFERNNNVGKSGDYQDESIKILPDVKGVKVVPGITTVGVIDNWVFGSTEFSVINSYDIVTPGATETRPNNISKNKYVLL